MLAIETSNPPAGGAGVCVARVTGGEVEVLSAAPLEPRSRHDDALMPAIDTVVRGAGLRARDLDAVAVSLGPGGYTAVRVAVTAAQLIGESIGAVCLGVSTAHALARAAEARSVAVALAWKRDTVWVQRFTDAAPDDEGGIVRLEELVGVVGERTLIAEDRLLDRLRGIGHAFARAEALRFSAESVARCGTAIEPIDPARLLPIYPREPEAVRKWRARPSSG